VDVRVEEERDLEIVLRLRSDELLDPAGGQRPPLAPAIGVRYLVIREIDVERAW
jgi:hypothetical protein